MEESMISTNHMSKALNSSDGTNYSSDQESSWSFYLEDFVAYPCDREDYENDSFFSGCESSSMVSDAACSAIKKHQYDNDDHNCHFSVAGVPLQRICGRSSAKRRKTKALWVDHDLEDTASSPDHSPKGNGFKQFYINSKEMMDTRSINQEHNLFQKLHKQQVDDVYIGISQGKGDTSNQKAEKTDFLGKESYYTELRRKGLCLVPVSMLFNCVS